MNICKRKIKHFPVGVWFAFIALILIFFAWIMQAYSLYNWEAAVQLGLQNGSFKGNAISKALAIKERGEAIADLLWVLPITIVAFIGLLKMKFAGFVAAMMVFAVCVYFPLFYIFQLWDTYIDTALGAVFLWGVPSLIGIIGLWNNREYFKGDI